MDKIDVFYPDRMAQRILGMGDIATLVERAQTDFDEIEARKLEKKIRKNQFDFNDFKKQVEQLKKMGSVKDILSMVPGIGKSVKDIEMDDSMLIGITAMINSMTPQEEQTQKLLIKIVANVLLKVLGKVLMR